MDKEVELFFEIKYANGEQVHEKVLNISEWQSEKGKLQPRLDIAAHRCKKALSDKVRHVFKRIWREGNSCAVLVKTESYTTIMENSVKIPEKTRRELPYEPVISLLGIHPKETTPTCQNNAHPLPSHAPWIIIHRS